MMKSLNELGQNLMKDVSETSTAIMTLSGEDWKLSPQISNKARASPSLDIILEVLARAVGPEKDKRHPDRTRRVKTISIHVWHDLIHRESQESTETSIRVNRKLSEMNTGVHMSLSILVSLVADSCWCMAKPIQYLFFSDLFYSV